MQCIRKPMWTDGMFLRAEHLAFQEQYMEALLCNRIHHINPYAWGISSIEIDEEKLRKGTFEIRHCEGVFKNGVPFQVDRTDGPIQYLIQREKIESFIDLFLMLQTNEPNSSDATLYDGYHRSVCEIKACHDLGKLVEIPWARPILKIGTSAKMPHSEGIFIARIRRTSNDEFELDSSVIPPLLWIRGNLSLSQKFELLQRTLETVQTDLENICFMKMNLFEYSRNRDLFEFSLLQEIRRFVAEINYFLSNPSTPLFRVHHQLLVFEKCLPWLFHLESPPEYNHENIAQCIGSEIDRIVTALRSLTPSVSVQKLEARPDHVHYANVSELNMTDSDWFLEVSGIEMQMLEQTMSHMKIASWSTLPTIVNTSISGVKLGAIHRSHDNRSCCYVRIETTSSFWKEIVQTKTIAIYTPNNVAIRMIGVRKS